MHSDEISYEISVADSGKTQRVDHPGFSMEIIDLPSSSVHVSIKAGNKAKGDSRPVALTIYPESTGLTFPLFRVVFQCQFLGVFFPGPCTTVQHGYRLISGPSRHCFMNVKKKHTRKKLPL